jgi:hypothetical protein
MLPVLTTVKIQSAYGVQGMSSCLPQRKRLLLALFGAINQLGATALIN